MSNAVTEMRLGGRTKAYRWMWDHYQELVEAGGLHWPTVAKKLIQLGCGGRNGLLSPEAARKTFERVQADQKAVRNTISPKTASGLPAEKPALPPIDEGFENFTLKRG